MPRASRYSFFGGTACGWPALLLVAWGAIACTEDATARDGGGEVGLPCTSSDDCAATQRYCDDSVTPHVCRACTRDQQQCPGDQACLDHRCQPRPACSPTMPCPAEWSCFFRQPGCTDARGICRRNGQWPVCLSDGGFACTCDGRTVGTVCAEVGSPFRANGDCPRDAGAD